MLQNLPIRAKLFAVLAVPLLVLTALTSVEIRSNVTKGDQADRVNRLAGFAVQLSGFVHDLQRERGLSAGYVAGGAAGDVGMTAQRARVDQDLRDVGTAAAALDLGSFDPQLGQRLLAAQAQLARLGAERQAVERRSATVGGTLDYYSGAVARLLEVESEVELETRDSDVLRNASALLALARAKEAASQERDLVNAVLSVGRFAAGQYQRFVTLIGSEETWTSQFLGSASRSQRALYARTATTGPDVQRAAQLRGDVLESGSGGEITADLSRAAGTAGGKGTAKRNATTWYAAMSARIDLLRQVETSLAGDLAGAAAAARSSASRQAAVSSAILLLALVLTVGISLVTAGSMVGPLRTLRRAAIDVAEHKLPGVVERLQGGEPVDVASEAPPLGIVSRDEIGQVADAFTAVHRVAVQVATEQAALRKSVGDTFLNLARRSQALVHRQLKLIDRLERKTTDPDELEELFRLDHLATRMRRNAEDLIVLSGAKPARRWGRPVALNDVVRGAIAEVEDYTRVSLLPVAGVALAGQAVGDVIHLLAELIENATSFSPPHTKVHVAGQPSASGYAIEIEDRGIGMSDAELAEANERLAGPPATDLALSQRLGLFVVARLAEHHGIGVQLRHSWYGGVTALVSLPEALVAEVGAPQLVGAGRPAELPAPVGTDEAPPANGGNGLPIFEAARSDWFDRGGELVHLPLRRRGVEDLEPGLPGQAGPPPPEDGLPPPVDEAPAADRVAPAEPPATTVAGLPRRIPRANLAPGIPETAPPSGGPAPGALPRRSPDDVRTLLSSYRSSVERGRHEASTDALRSPTPEAGQAPTPEAGQAPTPEAGQARMPEAGQAPGGGDDEAQ